MRRRADPDRGGLPGLDRAGFKLVATGLRECLARPENAREGVPSEQELERLFMALA